MPAQEQEAKIARAKKIAHAVTEGDREVLRRPRPRIRKRSGGIARPRKSACRGDAAASKALGGKLYNVIYADPPWRFEVYDMDSGSDRNADNHYPTMLTADIAALKVPAAKDAVLFLWSTSAMLPDALSVMQAWGFTYKASASGIRAALAKAMVSDQARASACWRPWQYSSAVTGHATAFGNRCATRRAQQKADRVRRNDRTVVSQRPSWKCLPVRRGPNGTCGETKHYQCRR